MANPNDAVGTNGAFGGRTSVNAFNDILSAFSGRGIVSGWGCAPSSGLTVQLGGNGANRDVAIAEDASGNKTTINNISQAPVAMTVSAAPASNSRIDVIVAYVEDSPQGSGVTDNPDVVNLLVVSGAVASSPIAPNDSAIRTAITADGASGATAYYVVLAQVTIPTGTTDIDATMISAGPNTTLSTPLPSEAIKTDNIASNAVTAEKIDFRTLSGNYSTEEQDTGFTWIDGKPIYKKTLSYSIAQTGDNATPHNISNLSNIIKIEGILSGNSQWRPASYGDGGNSDTVTYVDSSNVVTYCVGSSNIGRTMYATLYYTKNS